MVAKRIAAPWTAARCLRTGGDVGAASGHTRMSLLHLVERSITAEQVVFELEEAFPKVLK
jgi:hypothetical protein